jgi:hypothetical protein
MTSRKDYSPRDLAEQFRQLKTLRIQVAKAELSSSRKSAKETKTDTKAKQPLRDAAKQR